MPRTHGPATAPVIRLALALLLSTAASAQPSRVRVALEGKLHADARVFPAGPAGDAPGFVVRRARLEATVEVSDRLRLVIEPDVGEGEVELKDGYAEADVGHGLTVRAGQFKVPFGYESLRSSTDLRFAERAFPTALSPRRDAGVGVGWARERLDVAVGVFNGVPDGASRGDGRALDVAARVFVRPRGTGFGLGLAATAGTERGDAADRALSDVETPGDRPFFDYAEGVVADGPRLRLGPQATLDAGRLHVLGVLTWAHHRVAAPLDMELLDGARLDGTHLDLTHRAWQAAASLVLVGEPQGADRPVPRRGVFEGGPGVVEVSARLHGIALDSRAAAPGSAGRATAAAAAVHWSPTVEARLGVTVERTVFPDGVPAETFVVVRAQIDV